MASHLNIPNFTIQVNPLEYPKETGKFLYSQFRNSEDVKILPDEEPFKVYSKTIQGHEVLMREYHDIELYLEGGMLYWDSLYLEWKWLPAKVVYTGGVCPI